MNPDTIIKVYLHDQVICIIDSENPDLAQFVNILISVEIANENYITCKTEMKDFDIISFQELIKQTVVEAKQSFKSETDRYEQIKQSIICDKSVKEYYEEFIST